MILDGKFAKRNHHHTSELWVKILFYAFFMNQDNTQRFVSKLQELMLLEPTVDDSKQVSRCLMDYLGATIAGVSLLKSKTDGILNFFGMSKEVTPIGINSHVSVETASLINGLNSHVAEMDDGVRFGMIHPGAPIFSALLPVAEIHNVNSQDFIKGVLVGYDAALRLACTMQPTHYNRGYHPTATCGSIGASMGIAAMLGFNHQEMENSLGAISVAASGTLKVVESESELKPFNVGRASALGIQSAVIGKAGFRSPNDVLSGKTGFLNMTTDNLKLDFLFKSAINRFWIHNVYVKPYAACRHAHPSIEAALSLMEKHSISIKNIKEINITTYHGLKGRHDGKKISSISSARMSIPFSVAIALRTGNAGINAFTHEAVRDPKNQSLATKVFIHEDRKYTDQVPEKRSAMLQINLYNGSTFSQEVVYPKGEPENPMSDNDLEKKFKELAVFGGVPYDTAEMLIQKVWEMPKSLDIFFEAINNFYLKECK